MKTVLKLFLAIVLLIVLFLLLSVPKLFRTKNSSSNGTFGLHYGINQTPDFFDQAYKNIPEEKTSDQITGITVNHHLLAPNLIAREFSLVATDKPITVVLLSPNHFYRGNGGAITSKYDWQTPYGVLKTNQEIVTKLQQTDLVNIDEMPFDQEHGINGIVGFIKRSLPNATFVPLIVKDNFPDKYIDKLAQSLKDILPSDSLIVGSLDFSHYLTSNGAQFHDIQTLATINNFDYERIKLLDVDSHQGLRLLLKYFDLTGNKKFVVTSHENSSTITGNYNFIETTSYINGYFTQGQNVHDNHRTVLYVQGTNSGAKWKPDVSERLYKYNDEATTIKPKELESVNLPSGPLVIGLVYDTKLTDIYLFPLNISNNIITLMPQPKPDTMHIQIK